MLVPHLLLLSLFLSFIYLSCSSPAHQVRLVYEDIVETENLEFSMPQFVPVYDPEKPRSEQTGTEAGLLKHRQWETPHAQVPLQKQQHKLSSSSLKSVQRTEERVSEVSKDYVESSGHHRNSGEGEKDSGTRRYKRERRHRKSSSPDVSRRPSDSSERRHAARHRRGSGEDGSSDGMGRRRRGDASRRNCERTDRDSLRKSGATRTRRRRSVSSSRSDRRMSRRKRRTSSSRSPDSVRDTRGKQSRKSGEISSGSETDSHHRDLKMEKPRRKAEDEIVDEKGPSEDVKVFMYGNQAFVDEFDYMSGNQKAALRNVQKTTVSSVPPERNRRCEAVSAGKVGTGSMCQEIFEEQPTNQTKEERETEADLMQAMGLPTGFN
eukprot:GHVQ01013921.1.p2 GENE.GHVQ01013921.1~~GHVQ01013921.1.p2  ORF type:complete len:378 (+),score=66.10 GHVQ01013921.1:2116-3249(+)